MDLFLYFELYQSNKFHKAYHIDSKNIRYFRNTTFNIRERYVEESLQVFF